MRRPAMVAAIGVVGVVALVILTPKSGPTAALQAGTPMQAEAPPPPRRIDAAAIAAVTTDLKGWAAVRDVLYDADRAVPWTIAVDDDGTSRQGLAESVCGELASRGLVDQRTSVRIVDLASVHRTNGDFRAASLGHVDCRTGATLGT